MIDDEIKRRILAMLDGDDELGSLLNFAIEAYALPKGLHDAEYREATIRLLSELMDEDLVIVYWIDKAKNPRYDIEYNIATEKNKEEILSELKRRWIEHGKLDTLPYAEVAFFTLSDAGEEQLELLRKKRDAGI